MNTREMAFNIVSMMDEVQLAGFVSLFHGMISDIPNDETVAAMGEAERMLKDPNAQKFNTIDSLFEELSA